MNFTFGIVTAGNGYVPEVIESIRQTHIPITKLEIIVVGGPPISGPCIKHVPFDETVKENWITRKKNIITQQASNENIVYLHDYIKFDSQWYEGFLNIGNEWKVCMTRMQNADGTRFRDWCLDRTHPAVRQALMPDYNRVLLPYNIVATPFQYISGAYFIAKKHVMLEFPLNESLLWGMAEDIEWSTRVRNTYQFTMNPHSSVVLMKQKEMVFTDAPTGITYAINGCTNPVP